MYFLTNSKDEIVRSLWPLDPDGTLFSLTSRPTWGDAVARSLKSASIRDLLAAPEDMKDMETGKERRDSMFRSPSYSVRVTVHAGTDLQKLLYNPTTCPYCADQTPSGKVCIAAEHVGRFVRHILRGIQGPTIPRTLRVFSDVAQHSMRRGSSTATSAWPTSWWT